jgi:hypothetical protein
MECSNGYRDIVWSVVTVIGILHAVEVKGGLVIVKVLGAAERDSM